MNATQRQSLRDGHSEEVAAGERFRFGANWSRFLSSVDEEGSAQPKNRSARCSAISSLVGKTFLDVGSGSGFLVSRRGDLGAKVVHSTMTPNRLIAPRAEAPLFCKRSGWRVESGSVLDSEYLASSALRHRLFLGRAAPHRQHAGGVRECYFAGSAGWQLFHCHLQRSRTDQRILARRQARLQQSPRSRSTCLSRFMLPIWLASVAGAGATGRLNRARNVLVA